MDRTFTVIGVLLIAAAAGLLLLNYDKVTQPPAPPPPTTTSEEGTPEATPAMSATQQPREAIATDATPPASTTEAPEQTFILENDFIRAELSTRGGAINTVAFKAYPAVKGGEEPYLFNATRRTRALSLNRVAGRDVVELQGSYEVIEESATRLVFRRTDARGMEITRTYEIVPDETDGPAPYTIRHETQFFNASGNDQSLGSLYLNLGSLPPSQGDPWGRNLNIGYWDGDDFDTISGSAFKDSSFLGLWSKEAKAEVSEPVRARWGAVKNQFFVGIVTPENPAQEVYARPVFFANPDNPREPRIGITGSLRFDYDFLRPGESRFLRASYYVGPKEYARLAQMEDKQDKVMQFWILKPLSVLQLKILTFLESIVANYGLAIVLLVIIIRGLMWPLTAKAAKSSRNMQKIQQPMKELREKYKDEPQKLQSEMMKLWREHKVNPVAGCLPILLQLPIFIALFYMLRSASELRFEGFLWVSDLSAPDTIATVAGFPLNLMPILYLVSMYYQMKLMPTPTVDASQAKLMRWMPFLFIPFVYFFSSGLVLYWTCSNCFSIYQQYHTNKKRDAEEAREKAAEETTKPKSGVVGGPIKQNQRRKKKESEQPQSLGELFKKKRKK